MGLSVLKILPSTVVLAKNEERNIFYWYFCEFDMYWVCIGTYFLPEIAKCSHTDKSSRLLSPTQLASSYQTNCQPYKWKYYNIKLHTQSVGLLCDNIFIFLACVGGD